ncbi:phosphatidate cytidylyltransferase [Endozoicomonas sp. G2_1]|uniref:phosphatidate cytidylyltransferase n=1 Tax=Endozoicomonas sp. G2_1 TaxID=2821091 RepID=UPI001AD968E9|nr:phosphatidate cytidylyltransferase [Endozoicomonas sp. G2_1]MBO9492148.1 phosphatidate cytidylyltransferase [Endozoicomonas sp. G2_1]
MLLQRVLTALVLAPLAIAAIFYLPLTYFALLLIGLLAVGAWEWGPLMGFQSKPRRLAFTVSNVLIIGAIWSQFSVDNFWLDKHALQPMVMYLLWLSVLWWVLSAFLTLVYPRYSGFWSSHRSVRGLFGWLTLVPTWLAFVTLRSSDYDLDPYQGAQLLMYLFLMVWSADIGAYFVGKSIGKHKLMPNVSPGKTMEGFIGGVIFACLLSACAGYFIGFNSEQLMTITLVTAVITTISVLGDLNESMFKRQAGVKDSGSILPGHGGILDRIDSLTATAPVFALFYVYIGW